jgi:4-hydroxy-tetrahydrodipicolinate synthase
MNQALHRFGGFIADLPTPFDSDDKIDWPAFKMLCEHQIRSGATAIVVGETMGEASTLSLQEHGEIVAAAVRISRRRVAIIAGAGSNSTTHAIEATARAEAAGADAVMSVVPYYNKPMQAGILAHFQAIAASTALPIILHDVPSRTAREMTDETILQLSESDRFMGLNDSTGSIARLFRLKSMLPRGFRMFCGNDIQVMAYLASGGDGCISAMANLFPDLCRRIYDGCTMGNMQVASGLSARIAEISALLGGDSPVATLKYGMNTLGFMQPAVRLPLVELGADTREAVTLAMTITGENDRLDRPEAFARVARRSYAL